MFFPRGLPSLRIAAVQLAVDEIGTIDPEIMGEVLGNPGVGQHPLVENHHGVVVVEILETVGHRDDQPVSLPGYLAQQRDDLFLRLRIKPAGHFVAEKDRGTADEFHGKGQATLLTSRENLDRTVAELL